MAVEILYWHWIVLGVVLACLEILTPGFYILWIGIAGILTGAVSFFFSDLPFSVTGSMFAVFSFIVCYLGRSLYKGRDESKSAKKLNRRAEQYIGQTFTVVDPVINGVGKVKVGDTLWSVKVEQDIPEGTNVRISGVDGIYLVGHVIL